MIRTAIQAAEVEGQRIRQKQWRAICRLGRHRVRVRVRAREEEERL